MGIERPLTAMLPDADTRPVAHVLAHWALYHPDQFHLAKFGLTHIRSKLRGWAPDLEDGLAVEARWSSYGCLFEFIYGFDEGREYWIITRLAAHNSEPYSDFIHELSLAAFSPNKAGLIRLPDFADRTVNRQSLRTAHGLRPCVEFFGAPKVCLSHRPAAHCVSARLHFAPPWLPSTYLQAQVPKSSSVPNAIEGRHSADTTKEFDMKNYRTIIRLFSALPRGRLPFTSHAHAGRAQALPCDLAATPGTTAERAAVTNCGTLVQANPRLGSARIVFTPQLGRNHLFSDQNPLVR